MEKCDKMKKKRKRIFLKSWLSNEQLKSWIQKVPNDDSLYHCIICNKNYSCSSEVYRHEKSVFHKNKLSIKNALLSHNSNDKNVSSTTSNKTIFKKQWLEIKEFKIWLREVPNDKNSFFCCICKKIFSAKLSNISRHATSKIHTDNLKKDNNKEIITTATLWMKSEESPLPFEERTKLAEIRYAALIADKNISHDTAKVILKFFQDVGDDPNILTDMSMDQTKDEHTIANFVDPIETNGIEKTPEYENFNFY